MTKSVRSFLTAVCLFLMTAVAQAGSSQGVIFYATDSSVSGCAFDSSDPTATIQVHVYSEQNLNPVIGLAAYGCPWSQDPRFQGHGFQIQYRRPLASPDNVNVAFLNSHLADPTWVSTNQAQHKITFFNRPQQTLLYNTPNYQIGISLKYGAAVSEFYNNRVDSSMNLVTADPGSMIQPAFFGDDSSQVAAGKNCVGSTDNRYNPTQSATGCTDSSGAPIGSTVSECTSSNHNQLCGQHQLNVTPNDANPDWIQFKVHFRNFYAAQSSSSYQGYEDVVGYVKYTFKSAYAQIDYQDWKTNSATYGASFQQMPVAFLNQITQISSSSLSMARKSGDDRDYASSVSAPFGSSTGRSTPRWILAEALNNRPQVPNSSAGNFLTLGFYSAVVSGNSVTCLDRKYQGDFLGASSGADRAWMSVQHSAVVQNDLTSATMTMGNYYQSRVVLSAFRPTESVRGGQLSQVLDTLDFQGGSMPAWECNQPGGAKPAVCAPGQTHVGGSCVDGAPAPTPQPPNPQPQPHPAPPAPPHPAPAPQPPNTGSFDVNVYRFYNPRSIEHLFTTSLAEGQAAQFNPEGVGFRVSAHGGPGRVGLFRCSVPGHKHFVTTDAGCEGQHVDYQLGSINVGPGLGTTPLYRLYNQRQGDHMVTKNAGEATGGYAVISVLGYVPSDD